MHMIDLNNCGLWPMYFHEYLNFCLYFIKHFFSVLWSFVYQNEKSEQGHFGFFLLSFILYLCRSTTVLWNWIFLHYQFDFVIYEHLALVFDQFRWACLRLIWIIMVCGKWTFTSIYIFVCIFWSTSFPCSKVMSTRIRKVKIVILVFFWLSFIL